jgi:hypothetical protein
MSEQQERAKELVAQFGDRKDLKVQVSREIVWPLREGKVLADDLLDKLESALKEPENTQATVTAKDGQDIIFRVSKGEVEVPLVTQEQQTTLPLDNSESLESPGVIVAESLTTVSAQPEFITEANYLDLLNNYDSRSHDYIQNLSQQVALEQGTEFIPAPFQPMTQENISERIEYWKLAGGTGSHEYTKDLDRAVLSECVEQGMDKAQALNLILEQSPHVQEISREDYSPVIEAVLDARQQRYMDLVVEAAPGQSYEDLTQLAIADPEQAKSLDFTVVQSGLNAGLERSEIEALLVASPYVQVQKDISIIDTYDHLGQATASVSAGIIPIDSPNLEHSIYEELNPTSLNPLEAHHEVGISSGVFESMHSHLDHIESTFQSVQSEFKALSEAVKEGNFKQWATNQGDRVKTSAENITNNIQGRLEAWLEEKKEHAKGFIAEKVQGLVDRYDKWISVVDDTTMDRISPILPDEMSFGERTYQVDKTDGTKISRNGVSIYEKGQCQTNDGLDRYFLSTIPQGANQQVSDMVGVLAQEYGSADRHGDRSVSFGDLTMAKTASGVVTLDSAARGNLLTAGRGKIQSNMDARDYAQFKNFSQQAPQSLTQIKVAVAGRSR